MTDEYRTLRHNINMLGRFLGETINYKFANLFA